MNYTYDVNLRLGDTVEARTLDRVVSGRVIDVMEHGWYRDVAVNIDGRVCRLRLFVEEPYRRHSPVIECRLLRRRDRRSLTVFYGS